MRVFVAGATGVIGRLLTAKLVGADREVLGMTRAARRDLQWAPQHSSR